MPSVKKRFKCGHQGFGQFCHRCDQANQLETAIQAGQEIVWVREKEDEGKIPQTVKLTDARRKDLQAKIEHLRA